MDKKSKACYFVGCNSFNGYRLWDESTDNIIISRDVIFEKEKPQLENEDESSHDKSTASVTENDLEVRLLPHQENNDVLEEDVRRSSRITKLPSYLDNYVLMAEVPFNQAIKFDESNLWKAAMKSELDSLAETKTWTLVDPPENKKIITNRHFIYTSTVSTFAQPDYKYLPEDHLDDMTGDI